MIIAEYCVIFGLIIVVFALIAIGYAKDKSHSKERQDLYNRIMCGSIKEYTNIEAPSTPFQSRHKKVLKDWRTQKEVE